ncbi:hypothetical protein H4Q32_029841 [Labeo rohita]|uniref:NIPSNAP domain-containing protein n=1 Tax=Labeo rohita TaxID=84645 RepID=A0ABQ8M140_LABRO|nr:hypothetical protein H4Q32_029841 [Labeo rohita]
MTSCAEKREKEKMTGFQTGLGLSSASQWCVAPPPCGACIARGSRSSASSGSADELRPFNPFLACCLCPISGRWRPESFRPLAPAYIRLQTRAGRKDTGLSASNNRNREDSWFKSLFVRKVDPRKDAHSHLLAKKEDNNLYKIQFHNVKPECLEAYNKLCNEVLPSIHNDKHYPCELEFLEYRNERGKMLLSRRNQLLLEFSFWNEPVPRDGPNIYELRSYQLRPGTMIEWGNYWARAINYRQHNREAVGGFFSQIGDLYMVHHLWAYKDLQSREDTRNAAWQHEGWDEVVYYTVPLIQHMESRIMIPLQASPLQ